MLAWRMLGFLGLNFTKKDAFFPYYFIGLLKMRLMVSSIMNFTNPNN